MVLVFGHTNWKENQSIDLTVKKLRQIGFRVITLPRIKSVNIDFDMIRYKMNGFDVINLDPLIYTGDIYDFHERLNTEFFGEPDQQISGDIPGAYEQDIPVPDTTTENSGSGAGFAMQGGFTGGIYSHKFVSDGKFWL